MNPLMLPAPRSKPTPVMRASKGEVLVMVKVKVLVASLNETVTVAVERLPVLLPMMDNASARATELRANIAMAAAVVSKAFLNMVTSVSPVKNFHEVPCCGVSAEEPEQKSGFEFMNSRLSLSCQVLYLLSCQEKMSNAELFQKTRCREIKRKSRRRVNLNL